MWELWLTKAKSHGIHYNSHFISLYAIDLMIYLKSVSCMFLIRKIWHFLGVPISSAIERSSPRGVEGHSERV